MCFISSCMSSLCHWREFGSNLLLLLCLPDWIHSYARTLSLECALGTMSDDNDDDDELLFLFHSWTVNTMVHAPCSYSKRCFFWNFSSYFIACLKIDAEIQSNNIFQWFLFKFYYCSHCKSVSIYFSYIYPFRFDVFIAKWKISFYYLIRKIITNNMPLRLQKHDNLVQYCARPQIYIWNQQLLHRKSIQRVREFQDCEWVSGDWEKRKLQCLDCVKKCSCCCCCCITNGGCILYANESKHTLCEKMQFCYRCWESDAVGIWWRELRWKEVQVVCISDGFHFVIQTILLLFLL